MTEPQKYASSLTFAKRYSLCDILGISTSEEDTDATDVGKEKNAKSPKAKILFLLRTLGVDMRDKEAIAGKVTELTKLEPLDKNLEEIVSRLEVLVRQKNEDSKVRK